MVYKVCYNVCQKCVSPDPAPASSEDCIASAPAFSEDCITSARMRKNQKKFSFRTYIQQMHFLTYTQQMQKQTNVSSNLFPFLMRIARQLKLLKKCKQRCSQMFLKHHIFWPITYVIVSESTN